MADLAMAEQETGGAKGWLGWRGLLADFETPVRVIVGVFIVVLLFALSYTQLGFVGVGGTEGSYDTYLILLLAPVAAAALLYGVRGGLLLGLAAGAVAYAHSVQLPLDYYEINVITPLSTLATFPVIGLLLGLSVSLLESRVRDRKQHVVGIAVICLLSSLAYSALLMLCTFIWYGGDDLVGVYNHLAELTGTTASIIAQIGVDALAMFACCLLVEAVCKKLGRSHHDISLRSVFQGWLLIVIVIMFLLAISACFVLSTVRCLDNAERDIRSEITYIGNQLSDPGRTSIDNLLEGYTVELDGIVAVMDTETILLSDWDGEDGLPEGSSVAEILGDEEALEELCAEDKLIRTLYFSGDAAGSPSTIIYLLIEDVGDYYVLIAKPSTVVFGDRDRTIAWITLVTLLMLVAMYVLTSRLVGYIVVRRIDETNEVLGHITEGQLDERVNVRASREFTSLSSGINTMVGALKRSMDEITERVEAELSTAKAIQENALPQTFPPFPEVDRFDIFASMRPARHVGGDFYDFFLIGKHRLGFVIADVSGKGVPAALFMMTAKTQIENYMEAGVELVEAVSTANHNLCEGNETGMFVTAFAGVLDYANGHVEYVNAGHNPPLLRAEGSWRWLNDLSGVPLGLFDGLPYEKYTLEMQPHDMMLLYTDGVTEAMNAEGELFGEKRLEALLADRSTGGPRQLIEGVQHALAEYVNGAEQSDDITMLSFEYGAAPEVWGQITVPAQRERLPEVLDVIHTELNQRFCPLSVQNQLDIAVEELFVNIANYAYGDAEGEATMTYVYRAVPQAITVELSDTGMPFDPLAKPDAVTPDDIMDVPIGGLGILMAKKSVDKFEYRRENGRNIVTMTKYW